MKKIIIALLCALLAYQIQKYFFHYQTLKPDELNKFYDYIIVGAGSAGCVLAARLSEDPSKSVLLLEAGGEENDPYYTHVPAAAPFLVRTKYDWDFITEPQSDGCQAMDGGRSNWPRGKGLGGTSILNWMIYVRGHPIDFDHWEDLGNRGWSYKDLLPYFNRAETTEVEELQNSQFHGHHGPLHISLARSTEPGEAMLRAAKELGLQDITDSDGKETGGFARIQLFANKGIRESVVRRYLRPAMHRKNLHVITNAHATKVLFSPDGHKPTAIGVEYLHSETLHKVKANREVILSAGSVNSPQILMLSGIGPADHLRQHNVPVLVDSPSVGKNLDDHLEISLMFSINVTRATDFENVFEYSNLVKSIPQLLLFGNGPLSTPPLELVGYFYSGLNEKHKGPDLQLYLTPCNGAPDPEYVNYKKEVVDIFEPIPANRSSLTISACLLHRHSQGEIRLRSKNPLDRPLIDPKYFHNDKDDKILAAGLRQLIKLLKTKTMSKYDPKFMEKPMPGCSHHKFLSDDYLACLAKHRAYTLFHPIGTCKMGSDISNSVVDSDLKVHGIDGLRIVDASVFPDQTSGNTNAPVIMVAEKAADLIKNQA